MLDAQKQRFIQTWHAKKKRNKLSSNTLRIQVCKTVRIKAVEKGKTGKQRTNSKYVGNTPYYAKLFQGYFLEVNHPEAFSIKHNC